MDKRVSLAYEVAGSQGLVAYARGNGSGSSGAERMYANGFHGCFVDGEGSPWWARTIARYERDQLEELKPKKKLRLEDIIGSEEQAKWEGGRAVNWNAWTRRHPRALKGSQDHGNCTAWGLREIGNCERATDVESRGEMHAIRHRIGTAVFYGSRGHGGQGSALSTLVRAFVQIGANEEREYPEANIDFSNENTDESYGNRWGRSGVPRAVKDAVEGDGLEDWATTTDKDAILDVLDRGHFLFHGSMLTARANGKLVTPLKSIGGHAQALIGYDDTDEARKWIQDNVGQRVTEPLVFNDQSWGASFNAFPQQYWPTHLWGDRPEGVWVITLSDLMRIVRQWNDCIAISNVVGFPTRTMPDWGSSSYL